MPMNRAFTRLCRRLLARDPAIVFSASNLTGIYVIFLDSLNYRRIVLNRRQRDFGFEFQLMGPSLVSHNFSPEH